MKYIIMKIKQYSFYTILILCASCVFDPPRSHVRIENYSHDTIKIVVNFNRQYVSSRYKEDTCFACVINSVHCYDSTISVVKFDTASLIGSYKITPGNSFRLFLSLYGNPEFEFDSIKVIHYPDTFKIAGRLDELEHLKKHKWQIYELRIK